MAMMKQIIFNIGEGLYGIDVSRIMGIEKDIAVVGIPNAPACIKGIINLRGDVIPVFSLREKFNIPYNAEMETKELIIAKSNGVMIAVEVDMVKEIVELDETTIASVPLILRKDSTRYMEAVAHVNKKLILVINLDGLLDEEQVVALQNIVENQ